MKKYQAYLIVLLLFLSMIPMVNSTITNFVLDGEGDLQELSQGSYASLNAILGSVYDDTPSSNTWQTDLYTMTDHGVIEGTISNVNIDVLCKQGASPGGGDGRITVKTHSTVYTDAEFAINNPGGVPPTVYDAYSMNDNPNTGSSWTWTEIDNLQPGIGLKNDGLGDYSYCFRMWVNVTYTPSLIVTTDAPTSIEETTVTLSGSATGADGMTCGFWLGNTTTSTTSFERNITCVGTYNNGETFTSDLTDITQTEYYFVRAWSLKTGIGFFNDTAEQYFLTKPDPPENISGTITNNTIAINWSSNGTRAVTSYYRKITIDHTMIDSDLKHFPVLVVVDSAIGAKCDDNASIRFYSSDNSTAYAYDIEYWDATGNSFIWVNITTIDSATDTIFYMRYGNDSLTDNQQPYHVWNGEFDAVYHMGETAGHYNDRTSRDRDATFTDADSDSVRGVTGIAGKATDFNGDLDYIETPANMSLSEDDTYTFEAWIEPDDADDMAIMGIGGTLASIWLDAGILKNRNLDGGAVISSSGYTLATGKRYYVAATFTAELIDFFVNDSAKAQNQAGGNDAVANTNAYGGGHTHGDGAIIHFDGVVDEIRFSNVVRNTSWLKASFYTTNYTCDFITFGTEQTVLGNYSNETTVVRYKTSSYPVSVSDGVLLHNATSNTTTLTNWLPDVTYYFSFWTYINASGSPLRSQFSDTYVTLSIDTPTYPTDLTIKHTFNDTAIPLAWIKGENNTVIIRNSTHYPSTPYDGTEIYNGSLETFTDTGLSPSIMYYYRAWDYGDEFSIGNSSNATYTEPRQPYNINTTAIIVTATTINVNLSWQNHSDYDYVLIRKKLVSPPSNIGDGTLVYNGTRNYTVDLGLTEIYYYSLWNFNVTTGLYSDKTNATFYLVWVNCYNESGGDAVSPFTVFFTNEDGSETYFQTNCSNPVLINVSDIPTGDNIALQVNATGYKTRVYYFDIEVTGNFYIDVYLSHENQSYVYLLSVVDEIGNSVPDAKITVKRYVNETVGYEDVSIEYADGYGQVSMYLIPEVLYKFDLYKDGYKDQTANWLPTTEIFAHTFLMQFEEIVPHPPDTEPENIVFEGYISGDNILYLNYTDALEETLNTTITVYEINLSTGIESVFGTNTTSNVNSFQTSFSSINTSNTYKVILFYNHTTFGYQTKTLIFSGDYTPSTSAAKLNTLLTAIIGTNPFGWANLFIFFFLCAGMYYADERDSGKILVLLGGMFLFLNIVVGFTTTLFTIAGGAVPLLFIVVGILVIWKESNKT